MPQSILVTWGSCLGLVLLGTGALAGLGWLLCRRSPWATARRTIWRLTLVGFLTVFLLEVTGLAGVAGGWLAWRTGDRPEALAGSSDSALYQEATLAPLPSDTTMSTYLWVPLALWLTGTAVWLGRFVWGQLLLARLRRRLLPAGRETTQEVNRLRRVLHCPRPVKVGVLPGLQGPLVFGVRRPVLALPPHFTTDFSAEQQTAILTHELSHLAARDPSWHLGAEGLTALLWWNPLVWWVRGQLRRESEAAADEATLHLHDGPGLLAESLVILGRRLSARPVLGSLAMADVRYRSHLAQRVDALLRLEEQPLPTTAQRCGLLVRTGLLLLLALLGCLTLRTSADARSWEDHWQHSPLMQTWTALRPTPPRAAAVPVRRLLGKDPGSPPILAVPLGHDQDLPTTNGITYVHDVIQVDDGKGGTLRQNVLRPMRNGQLLTEDDILRQLQLTPEQRRRWAAHRQQMDAATLELYRMTSGHVERGKEINQFWRRGLQEIFTPEQYQRYLAYWG